MEGVDASTFEHAAAPSEAMLTTLSGIVIPTQTACMREVRTLVQGTIRKLLTLTLDGNDTASQLRVALALALTLQDELDYAIQLHAAEAPRK